MFSTQPPELTLATTFANLIAVTGSVSQIASVDLHGLSVEKARAIVIAQIKAAPEQRWDKIRFITGRGNHLNASGKRGTLYHSFKDWLGLAYNPNLTMEQFDGFYEISIRHDNTIVNPLDAHLNADIQALLRREIKQNIKGAQKKNPDAMLALAVCYDLGLGVKKDYSAAYRLFQEVADKHHLAYAQYETGTRLFIGTGVRQNDAAAARYLTLSAEQGYVLAEFTLATIYQKGTAIIEPDLTRALQLYLAAAQHQHPLAARKAGTFYYQGLGCATDIPAAITLWRQATDLGEADAALNLVHIYESTTYGMADANLAEKYLRLAATLGNADGQFLLGLRFYFGLQGTLVDEPTGINWLQQAADKKHADALMFMYYLNCARGDLPTAAQQVIAAAYAGEITAQYHLTCMPLTRLQTIYQNRALFTPTRQNEIKQLFLKRDNAAIFATKTINTQAVVGYLMDDQHGAIEVKKGLALMQLMATAGSTWAMHCLAGTFLEGHNDLVKINPQLAYTYLLHGEKLNDAACLTLLGRYWAQGQGTHLPANQRVDKAKALGFITRACAQDHLAGYNELGNFYHTNQQFALALSSYYHVVNASQTVDANAGQTIKSQATHVLPHALANLGRIYFKGYPGVPHDKEKGLYFIDMAAHKGLAEAANFLFHYYQQQNVIEKLIYYGNLAASLGEQKAILFMQAVRRDPRFTATIDTYTHSQPVSSAAVVLDPNYSLLNKTKIADTPALIALKNISTLPFFAVNTRANTVDAIVECKTPQDYCAVATMQNGLHRQGKFFKNANKKKFFVLEDITQIMTFCAPTQR